MKFLKKAYKWALNKVTGIARSGQSLVAGTATVLTGELILSSEANAALPAAATTAFTDLQTDALALVDLAWTALIPITVAFIILRMFRRAASSAT